MTPALILLGLALAPWLSMKHTGPREASRARDLWLLAVCAFAVILALEHAPLFAPMALWFLLRWRQHDALPSVLTWVAIAGTWWAASILPAELRAWLPPAWVATGCCLTVLLVAQRLIGERVVLQGWRPRVIPTTAFDTPRRAAQNPYGWFGQRTFASAYLALVLPFAPPWALPILIAGFMLTGPSFLALLGLCAGGVLLDPRVLYVCLPGLLLLLIVWRCTRWLEVTNRGDSWDSVWARLTKYRLILHHLTWWGAGPGTMDKAVMRWNARFGTKAALTGAHCEPLQHLYEFGVLGAATVLLLAVDVGARVRVGDPWSASAVTAAVICLATHPLRIPAVGLTMLAIWAGVGR